MVRSWVANRSLPGWIDRCMELTELLPRRPCGLNINWEQAIRYAGLNAAS